MARKRYQCQQCGCKFIVNVLSDKEKEEFIQKRRPIRPIRCKECGSGNIIEI